MTFVVLALPCNKQIHTRVSARHNDQYQADTRATIALLTMRLWRLLGSRRSLNMLKPERIDPELFGSPMVLPHLTQPVCFN